MSLLLDAAVIDPLARAAVERLDEFGNIIYRAPLYRILQTVLSTVCCAQGTIVRSN